MANPWFRLYAEFAIDPKVQMLSEIDQRRFVMLLCLRCSNGDVTLHDEEMAFQLRISNDEWLRTKAILVAKNLIDELAKPVAWDKRQFVSDSSAARVSKHREKKKQPCNVTVTPPDTDTDTDTYKEKPLSTPPVGFAEFWSAYPKKVGKGAAEKSWKKLRPDLQTVLQAIKGAAISTQWLKDGGQYIPNPATWLNQRRWEDESAPATQVSPKDSQPWFMSAAGIEREAARIGVKKLDGEVFPYFKKRVYEAAGITPDMLRNPS